jgi:hypothetical protein
VSALVFPTFAGLKIEQTREAIPNTLLPTSITRVETPFSWESYCRYRYRLDIEVLRSDSSLSARTQEWQKLVGFHARMRGSLDTFLFTDDEDNSVTDHGFAAGDGSTAAFQIQRTQKGAFTDAAGAIWPTQTKPYRNLVRDSSFENDGNADGISDSWSAYNNSSSTEPSVARIIPGRTGGNAQRISWGTANTTTKGVTQSGGTPVVLAGQWYTAAFFARASGTNIGKWMGIRNNSPNPNQKLFLSNPALSAVWQLYVFQVFWNAGASPLAEMYITINNSATGDADVSGTFGDLDIDDVLFVAGQYDATTLPQPFTTPVGAAATRNPSYWPVLGDGFEPVFDLNGSPTIYQDGDWQGRRQLYPWTRTNVLWWSEQIDNAGWTKTNATVTANATTAPDGTATADQISEGTAVTVQHGVTSTGHPGETPGQLWCWSVFVKANSLPNIFLSEPGQFTDGLKFNISTGVIDGVVGAAVLASGVITSPLWPGWYRVWFTRRATATTGTNLFVNGCLDGTYSSAGYTGTSRSFYAWGSMAEPVSNLLGPTPYIKTPSSAAVTVTDYTVGATGLVTPSTVLPAGAYLSADANYYRRCRFESDSLPSTRIVQSMWSASVSLLSIK